MGSPREDKDDIDNLRRAWKDHDAEKVVAIIQVNPSVMDKLDLKQIETKVPIIARYRTVLYGLLGSVVVLPIIYMYLWLSNFLPLVNNTDYAVFPVAGVLFIFGVAYASLISLKPFAYRSRNLATVVVALSSILFSVWYFVRFLVFTATATNIASAILVGAAEGGILGIFLGGAASSFVPSIIGKPIDAMPYCASLEFSSNSVDNMTTLLKTLDRLEWRLQKSQESGNPKIPSLAIYQRTYHSVDYRLGLHYDPDGTTFVKLLCYRDAGESVTSDNNCREQLCIIGDLLKGEGLELVKDPYVMSNPERALTYDRIWNFSLGYTDSRLEKWLAEHPLVPKRILRYSAIALSLGIVFSLALPTLGRLINPASVWWSENNTAISVLISILGFLGLNVNLSARIKRIFRRKTGSP